MLKNIVSKTKSKGFFFFFFFTFMNLKAKIKIKSLRLYITFFYFMVIYYYYYCCDNVWDCIAMWVRFHNKSTEKKWLRKRKLFKLNRIKYSQLTSENFNQPERCTFISYVRNFKTHAISNQFVTWDLANCERCTRFHFLSTFFFWLLQTRRKTCVAPRTRCFIYFY